MRASASAVSLLPVPAMTAAGLSTTDLISENNLSFSSWVKVGDSPVVPATTKPSLPDFNKARANFLAFS